MIEQGSDEWRAMRLGKATASRIADVMARTKSGWGAGRKNYMAELIAERLTGVPADNGFKSGPMMHGTETEDEARAAYAFYRDVDVEIVSFVDHPSVPMAGASPDGLAGNDGLVQFKCPNTATHLDTLLGGSIKGAYLTQMQWEMACTGRQWCDFASYDPRLPEGMRLFVKRIRRDDERVTELETEVRKFLAEIDNKVCSLRSAYELETVLAGAITDTAGREMHPLEAG